jgi:hypothetical protein
MKKVIIKNLAGVQTNGAEMEDPTSWIADCIASNVWGQPERWVPHKDEGGSYDDADVLDERLHEILPEVMQKQVKLKAEYTVEITDISAEYALEECISKRKSEYPSAEEFLNAFFDGGEQALAALQAKRLAVKAKYPKP